tara:strand:+ start:271 stop:552 length:282 start_codon:yes stop_codon:yes gene_type:complete
VRERWGSTPATPPRVPSWAQEDYAQRAEQDRQVLAQIEALPPAQAAALICERAEAERLAAAALAERAARLAMPERDTHSPTRGGPERGRGISL